MSSTRFDNASIQASADHLLEGSSHRPSIGIVCGTGLGGLADQLEDADIFPYEEIPHCPVSTVHGHAGRMVIGTLAGVAVICMQGRFHLYEGYPAWKTAVMIRVMKLVGVETVLLTNAAGGVNEEYKVGDVMLIKDHINIPGLAGESPLVGPNDDSYGPRFPGMANAYDKSFRQIAKRIADESGFDFVREGVYAMVGGPSFETVAELRFLKVAGANAVGMSTVAEVITARHCGMRVLAFSLITNQCIMDWDTDREANHAEVLEAAAARKSQLTHLVKTFVAEIGRGTGNNGHGRNDKCV